MGCIARREQHLFLGLTRVLAAKFSGIYRWKVISGYDPILNMRSHHAKQSAGISIQKSLLAARRKLNNQIWKRGRFRTSSLGLDSATPNRGRVHLLAGRSRPLFPGSLDRDPPMGDVTTRKHDSERTIESILYLLRMDAYPSDSMTNNSDLCSQTLAPYHNEEVPQLASHEHP